MPTDVDLSQYLTLGQIADKLGVQLWRLRRLFERGILSEPARVGQNRVVHVRLLPTIKQALEEAGYLKK